MKKSISRCTSFNGTLFLFSSTTYLFKLITPPEPTGAMKIFNLGLQASVYLMPVGEDRRADMQYCVSL